MRRATQERSIDYPVTLDNDYEIWSAFDNHYWSALDFIDEDGIIRPALSEGRYEQSERVIQRLLDVERELVHVGGLGVEAEAGWDQLWTPEACLGYPCSERCASPGGVAFERRACEFPGHLRRNHWALRRRMNGRAEDVRLEGRACGWATA